ncbi:MAG: hypothetical protein IKL06_00200 [Lachnospiraceae bacterium]|nr:hypothetical protein [Lachnospiraceae bacterium]
MSNRIKTNMLNWTMLISLIVVFATGILLKPFPGMWMGIAHGVSGIVLFVSAMSHSIKHMIRRK